MLLETRNYAGLSAILGHFTDVDAVGNIYLRLQSIPLRVAPVETK